MTLWADLKSGSFNDHGEQQPCELVWDQAPLIWLCWTATSRADLHQAPLMLPLRFCLSAELFPGSVWSSCCSLAAGSAHSPGAADGGEGRTQQDTNGSAQGRHSEVLHLCCQRCTTLFSLHAGQWNVPNWAICHQQRTATLPCGTEFPVMPQSYAHRHILNLLYFSIHIFCTGNICHSQVHLWKPMDIHQTLVTTSA